MTPDNRTPLSWRQIRRLLLAVMPAERVLAGTPERVAYSCDASCYQLVPQAVVRPKDLGEIRTLLELARFHRFPLTFRAAGTSLSGQAVTSGVLVDVATYWDRLVVLDGGARIKLQPGVIGARANRALGPYGRKLGPDPASLQACMAGGIIANNSSGMCCGVLHNAYHTLDALSLMLPSGAVVDGVAPGSPEAAGADAAFRRNHPELARGLLDLRTRIFSNPELETRIRAKYRIKNTTGYGLNAFVDFAEPLQILQHLVVGSEGTLGFIAEATLRTVPAARSRCTALLFFNTVVGACEHIGMLSEAGVGAIEIMDRAALRSVEGLEGVPSEVRELPPLAAGLLIEFQSDRAGVAKELEDAAWRVIQRIAGSSLASAPLVATPDEQQARLWKIRQGMLPSVAALRRPGTSVIIEDVAVPVERLAAAVGELQGLFGKHGFGNAIIFGHARDGNLHFVLTPEFADPDEVRRYDAFMRELAELIAIRHGGSLKAEHGTGRNVAPFVETEWGPAAAGIMRDLKALVDPCAILNPGVIIPGPGATRDSHLQGLKRIPKLPGKADDLLNPCMECGYCEASCPSRSLSLTPRQRIILTREIARGKIRPSRRQKYLALDTCAADGLCGLACPVGIDTGAWTKARRAVFNGRGTRVFARATALAVERHFERVEKMIRFALAAYRTFRPMFERLLPGSLLKRFEPLPAPVSEQARTGFAHRAPAVDPAAIYFPSCVSRNLGALPGETPGVSNDQSLMAALQIVALRAGRPVRVPKDVHGVCCGLPFGSKGFTEAQARALNRAIEKFWEWSDGGRLPVVIDTTPCTHSLKQGRELLTPENRDRFDRMTILDGIEFLHSLLPALPARQRRGSCAVHPVCSARKLGLEGKLREIAEAYSDRVIVPEQSGCCGFAGDRGWLVPELTAAATRPMARELAHAGCEGSFSTSRTCEIGMSRGTGRTYRSLVFLVEWATRDI